MCSPRYAKMLELAATRTQGAHPYFVTPEHTRRARQTLGPDPLLAPEQAVVVDTDPARARATARRYAAPYLSMPNYLNSLRELGFSDFESGGSDALIDAVVAWGDPESLGNASGNTTGPARTTSRRSPSRGRSTSNWRTCAGWPPRWSANTRWLAAGW